MAALMSGTLAKGPAAYVQLVLRYLAHRVTSVKSHLPVMREGQYIFNMDSGTTAFGSKFSRLLGR